MAKDHALDELICFQLYTASRLMQRIYRPYFDDWGITYQQYLVLVCLWERDGRSIGQLADPLNLDSGTLSPLLQRMEDNGFVRRKHVTDDFRRLRIFLTAKGKRLKPLADKMQEELVETLRLDYQDLAAVHNLMNKISP
ncbi:MarR family transcriptional regulator [Corynebacterium pseudotuberculosis]|uniref:MarR family winged helix-turn-helix transcriptional regulator n=1 Tax=Corynebacterium pseudotuberculosis TaxID=1719 RepID=UPI000655B9B3|nr:MarR family transcriptional regulator [Corynebacterium pseudotuberculosis]AFH89928.2 MarR family transcriptional regulator [Corynebacterium pseudotuberculosis 31]APB10041.1 MarR family transcriptional regulator [Corynebacterium pseudotuberculosis]APB12088.1 MarR family transcriptional regulator [Corynebacterium pseudotuberculosis]APB14134.1 MarR family transcriptional regulator [Corynebacterium pseudotuberculosis]APB16185.1 MarR family transcriptional regulator [Corynebacterium pseudotuberc